MVSGHLGWVRAIAFDPSNEWFVTGSADRTIKVWDLAKCAAGAEQGLKLTLTGHINSIRGLAISPRHPYLFSAAEDKKVVCWDLETNKVSMPAHDSYLFRGLSTLRFIGLACSIQKFCAWRLELLGMQKCAPLVLHCALHVGSM